MMEMDGRDSAKCRKSKLKDKMVIIYILNDTKDERVNSNSSSPLIGDKKGKMGEALLVT